MWVFHGLSDTPHRLSLSLAGINERLRSTTTFFTLPLGSIVERLYLRQKDCLPHIQDCSPCRSVFGASKFWRLWRTSGRVEQAPSQLFMALVDASLTRVLWDHNFS